MGFIDGLIGKKQSKNIALTDLGKEKTEQLVGEEGTAKFKIAAYLDEHGSSSLNEIAEGTGYSEKKVRIVCQKLIRDQWCKAVSSEG